jgi:hypothetical protein
LPRFTREFDSRIPLHLKLVMNKFKFFNVDRDLATSVNTELHSIKIPWQFSPITTDYYKITKIDQHRKDIDEIDVKYGPIIDTQKFTFEVFRGSPNKSFATIRFNPDSQYNRILPNTAKLVDQIQKINDLQDYAVGRMFINMQTIRPKWSMAAPHPDYLRDKLITVLYYVNNSDGDTFLFKGSECICRAEPIMGTGIVYPSTTLHAGSTPTKHNTRVVINIVFVPKEMLTEPP